MGQSSEAEELRAEIARLRANQQRLRASEPQAGHFDEFAVYPPKQAISVDVLADDMLPNFGTHGRSIDRGNQAEESVCEMANAVK